ncbi:MAG: glutathione peroxidase [Bacteroidales bacterium]|jgi:glutathione peroxidase|nr:glutathione peroxidase [Bacteroidales bacterium]
MKSITLFSVCLFSFLFFGTSVQSNAQDKKAKTSFYKLSFTSLDGKKVKFSSFKGKKVLLVNTASKCGYTPQYADLQKLSDQYKDQLVVIGFPSNDFGKQEPGTNEEIAGFCRENYGVTFLMMEKSDVKEKTKNVVYQWLTDKDKNGWNTQEPGWNFCKYLVDEKGNLLEFYPSATKPFSEDITKMIENK